MKLSNFTTFETGFHEWIEQGQNRYEVGTRGIESIEATAAGVVVTIVPEVGQPRVLLFTGPGVGAGMSDADAKRWEERFKAARAEAKNRAAAPRAHETPMEVP